MEKKYNSNEKNVSTKQKQHLQIYFAYWDPVLRDCGLLLETGLVCFQQRVINVTSAILTISHSDDIKAFGFGKNRSLNTSSR